MKYYTNIEKNEVFEISENIDGVIGLNEITSEEFLDIKSKIEKPSKINQYKEYLSATDWYYARKAEIGEEVPEDVVSKRVEAREFIRNHSAETQQTVTL